MASPTSTPFRATMSGSSRRESEDVSIFAGESSSGLSVPLEIRPSLWQRVAAVDWLDWASALGALLALYAVFGSYFYLLLYLAEVVRGDNFRVLPAKYYGPFQAGTGFPPVPQGLAEYPAGYNVPWNSSLSLAL